MNSHNVLATEFIGTFSAAHERVFTPDAVAFLQELHDFFAVERKRLLEARVRRSEALKRGLKPEFRSDTKTIRESDWRIASTPKDLDDRRVEITGPAEAKMTINALNSGAKVFMADLEDALCPSWANVVDGQICLHDAVRRTLTYTSPEGKNYSLDSDRLAVLKVRPRGWHLEEKHMLYKGEAMSGSLVDFGLFFFHNAKAQIERGTGPYFYLPKLESAEEARLWNSVFVFSQKKMGLPMGTIKATVLIETILAAFEMDEILYELREHIVGLNAGRWDYLFSVIKKFHFDPAFRSPDRAQLTMTVPFMRAYTELLVKTCHRRGAHAMGGMAAFIPSRKDPEVNRIALAKVKEDKVREARDGFDGTWVAHPDLVPVAREVFDSYLGPNPNQKSVKKEEVRIRAEMLVDFRVSEGRVTEAGFRNNVGVALMYIEAWLRGYGAVAIHNLMEDAATAEISRSQLWLWVKQGVLVDDKTRADRNYYLKIADEEERKVESTLSQMKSTRLRAARQLLDELVLQVEFKEFLTLPAYDVLKSSVD